MFKKIIIQEMHSLANRVRLSFNVTRRKMSTENIIVVENKHVSERIK